MACKPASRAPRQVGGACFTISSELCRRKMAVLRSSFTYSLLVCLLIYVSLMGPAGASVQSDASSHQSVEQQESLQGPRMNCKPGDAQPVNRANTTGRVQQLRVAMSQAKLVRGVPLKAYIITSDDEHQTEMVSPNDKRRHYVTGFTGSAGTAVITESSAALWTDGRYFLQADQQLDCQWTIMRSGQENVPTVSQWLKSMLSSGDRVGADPKLVSADQWLEWRSDLAETGIRLDAVQVNLVDTIWNEANGRPKPNPRPAYIHEVAYAGETWQEKVGAVRQELRELGVGAIVVTALDEIAWLLNLRGADVPFSPLVKSYVYLSLSQVVLFIDPLKLKVAPIREHLLSDRCGSVPGDLCVEIRKYDHVFNDLPRLVAQVDTVLVPAKYAYSGGVSYAIYETIPAEKRVTAPSPLILLKGQKNAVEVSGMKNAHLRDAVALCDFLSLIEHEVEESKAKWDELKVVSVLDEFRSQQELNRGPSFSTIAGFGPNGAVIHYRPSNETNRAIDNSSFLLIDSGGQYLDGTTDVTRTVHFGRATKRQKELYTRVLMAAIDLASLVFPESTDDTRIDVVARQHLYAAGLDYLHGTGHGIGAFLNVHESPIQIRIYGKVGHRFEENYFLSDEPGYYQENEFGIRLESILRVVRKRFEAQKDGDAVYLGFEAVTLVPFEPHLIVPEMMTFKQLRWLNDYHATVRTKVGEELKRQNKMRAFHWLMTKTRPITMPCHRHHYHGAASGPLTPATLFVFAIAIIASWP